ncbi:MAG: hypothetical protein QXV17_09280 [Candidatus Micrarchaeaceae archaeon]
MSIYTDPDEEEIKKEKEYEERKFSKNISAVPMVGGLAITLIMMAAEKALERRYKE